MEHQKQHLSCDSIYNGYPPITAKYPWLVAQNLDAKEDGQIFFNLNNLMSKYQSRIPELLGKCIRGSFHGWVILSDYPYNNNLTFSLWNPNTSKIIRLHPLILKDGDYESIGECCLSSPPEDPASILLLTRTNKPNFVFNRLDRKRKSVSWIEMSYDKQLKRITGEDGLLVSSLTCCNGKVYAINYGTRIGTYFIKVDILVKDREVVIKLSLFGFGRSICPIQLSYIKSSGTKLYNICIGFHDEAQKTPCDVGLFKLDMANIKREDTEVFKGLDMTNKKWEDMEDLFEDGAMTIELWEEMIDLKNDVFFVDISRDYSAFYSSTIASKFGGFIHIRGKMGEIIFSYHVKKKTISITSLPSPVLPTSIVSMWEYRFEDDHEKAKFVSDSKQEEEEGIDREIVVTSVTVELNESHLLNLPFPVLESIMELCVGVEYMKFRATCKHCYLAAPPLQWSDKSVLTRLQNYSLASPWLMVVDKIQGILTFADPIFGDNYFINNLPASINEDKRIYCSMFGWLLFNTDYSSLVFFNPFTGVHLELPHSSCDFHAVCFSAPPTSPDCMVVIFSSYPEKHVLIHFVAQDPSWHRLYLGADPLALRFPTFRNRDVYALVNEGNLIVFKDLGEENYSWKQFDAEPPRICTKSSAKYYLMTWDQHILLVVMGELGEVVEVFKWNDAIEEWDKIDSLGRHMIYIDDTTCLCIEAKIPEMENKIFFPRLHSENGKIVLYSLETCMYHTFNGKNIEGNFKDFIGLDCHLNRHAWIEPTWS